MNAICLVIDRLHAGFVGAYGNAWIRTPAMDRLACDGFTFDQALATCPRAEALCRSAWWGEHPLSRNASALEGPSGASLAEALSASGVKTALLTDGLLTDGPLANGTSTAEKALAQHLARGFAERIELPTPKRSRAASKPASAVEKTHMAGCFGRLIEHLKTRGGPFLTWVHLASLGLTWDAPYELRARYAEEDDPPPPESADVPRQTLPEDADPDVLLGITQSYAGQVTLLDMCLGDLIDWLDESPLGKETLLVLVSSRGFPLGAHGRVGPWDEALFGETVHVPMMVRLPDGRGASGRTQALVAPADLRPTLLEWWSAADPSPGALGKSLWPLIDGGVGATRDRLLLVGGDGETALRTPAWHLRRTVPPALYVKPDDRWEVSDVADRCHDVVTRLEEVAQEYENRLAAGRLDDLPPLDESLLVGPD